MNRELAFKTERKQHAQNVDASSACSAEGSSENLAGRQFVDDGVILPQWAERKYGGSQLDWLLQKDQVTRIQFKGLRIRDQILRVSWRHDLIVFCSNQQRRGLDSRGVLPNIHTEVSPDGLAQSGASQSMR